jgi:hypothetical protein
LQNKVCEDHFFLDSPLRRYFTILFQFLVRQTTSDD